MTTTPAGTTHRTVIDGVPALWTDLPIDPTTTLTFGVGYRDMPPRLAGITHLVEHLVMRRVGRVRYSVNAESAMSWTSFYVVGTPHQTVDFLRRVCEAVSELGDVTDADLETERRTILAEIGTPGLYAAAGPLSLRFGASGPGSTVATHARLLDWNADEVRDAVREWFHAGNAVLTSTRGLPEGLRLVLPEGKPVVRRPDPEPRLVDRVWAQLPGPLNLSGLARPSHADAALHLALNVLCDALTEATRTERGDVYSVAGSLVGLDHGVVVLVDLDPEPDQVETVLRTALPVLARLTDTGPDDEELAHMRETLTNELSLGAARAALLDAVAVNELRGTPVADVDALLQTIDVVTADEVRAVLADMAAALLVSIPLETSVTAELRHLLEEAGVRDENARAAAQPSGAGRAYHGKFLGPARRLVTVLYDDAIVLRDGGWERVMRVDELVLAGTDSDGDLELVTSTGHAYVLGPAVFRGLARPLRSWIDRLPAEVRYVKSRPGEPVVAPPDAD